MGNIIEEIERIEDAKSAINGAIIQSGGPAGEEDDLIDTYAERVRAIPSAVLSNLNVDKTGGAGSYIESIEQKDGKIVTTTGGTVSTSKSGLAPKIVTTNATTIATQDSELVLTSNGSTTVWKKLPANAFANNKVTLTAKSDNVAYPILLGPSGHTSGNTSGAYYDTGVTLNPSTNTIAANITGSAVNLAGGAAGSIPYQTAAGKTAFLAKGSNGQVLKINSSGLPYWTTDNNSNTWRAIQVNGDSIASTGTGTYALNFISGTGITPIGASGTDSTANTIEFNLNASKTDTLGGIKVAKVGTSAVTLLTDGNKYYGVNIDSNNKAYVALPAFTTTTGTVTSVTLLAGNGISISSTAAITSSGSRTITNAGVRSTTISGNYLRVNTGGTTTDLIIPFATTAKEAKSLTPYKDHIKITADNANTDNPLTWSNVGTSIHMYSVHNSLYGQPSQYGLLLNLAYVQDIHQIWATQSSGNLYHRGGNSKGWVNISDNNAWRTILDNVNSSVSGDGGSTWGSSITVKINGITKTLTIPSNPNTDAKVKQDVTTSNTYKPIILGYNSTSSTTSVTNQVYYSSNVYVNPSSGSLFLTGTGGLNLKASTDSGNPPQIRFSRGTETDTNTDWAIAGFSDGFQIRYKYSTNSWTNVFKATTTNTYIYKPLSITGGLSLTGALTSTVATGTAPLSIASTTKVTNLNADMLDGYHASDFFLNTDLLEGFSIEDLTIEATVRVSRSYYYNTSGVGSSTVYNTSGNGLTNPVSNSLLKPVQIGLKAPIIKVISVTKTGNASTYTANIGEQYITVNFSGTSVANTGDSFEFKLLLPAFNNS